MHDEIHSVCIDQKCESMKLTFTRAVRSTENGAFFYCTEWCEELAHIFLRLLFAEHTNEQLPICGQKEACEKGSRTGCGATLVRVDDSDNVPYTHHTQGRLQRVSAAASGRGRGRGRGAGARVAAAPPPSPSSHHFANYEFITSSGATSNR
ncbi:hypothetical protein EVAR_91427_1 [Eumeta japonica]|uniref:Uncharacterized protein n=1 Tax=Eumeta variegata TaxID=151549 RepID=A0A4C1X3G1_EUMVA|nr:hypothetical protein EVAR_91427_1 [Eumeta japonica]